MPPHPQHASLGHALEERPPFKGHAARTCVLPRIHTAHTWVLTNMHAARTCVLTRASISLAQSSSRRSRVAEPPAVTTAAPGCPSQLSNTCADAGPLASRPNTLRLCQPAS